jgi:hypothetical protein
MVEVEGFGVDNVEVVARCLPLLRRLDLRKSVESTEVEAFGRRGLVVLVWTVMTMMKKVERNQRSKE